MPLSTLLSKIGQSGLVQKIGGVVKSPLLQNLASKINLGGTASDPSVSYDASEPLFPNYTIERKDDSTSMTKIVPRALLIVGFVVGIVYGVKRLFFSDGKRRSYR